MSINAKNLENIGKRSTVARAMKPLNPVEKTPRLNQ